MPLRTFAVIAVLALVWLGVRRAEDAEAPLRPTVPDGRVHDVVAVADGIDDLVLEALDGDGRPVVALELTLEPEEGLAQGAGTIVRSLADAAGRYRLDGLLPGRWRITLTGRDARILDPPPRTLVTLPRAAPLRVTSESPATLELELTDHNGQPLPGVEVVLRPEAGAEQITVTDLLGRVRSGPLPFGTLTIDARRAGAERRHRMALAPEERAVVRLRLPGGGLTGQVLDAQRAPLGQQRIEVLRSPLDGGPPPQVLATATSDGGGRFEVPWLPPGPVLVRLVAGPSDGPGAPPVSLAIADGAQAEVTLAFAPTAFDCTLRGRLLLGQGPVAEAELTWVAAPRGGGRRNGTEVQAAHVVHTDRDGQFAVELEHAGPWVVLWALPGRPSIGLGTVECAGSGPVERDLFAPVGVLQGRVVDLQGQGIGGARLDCVPATPWTHGALHGAPVTVRTVADGSFEVGALLVGPWFVHAWPSDPNLARVQTQAVEVKADGTAPILNLVVPPAGALRVRFGSAALDTGDAVHIELRDAAGRYVFPEAFAVRGALGEGIMVPGLAAGTYRCAVRSASRVTEWTDAVAVRANEEAEVIVALHPGGELALSVVDPAGAPIAAALELLAPDGTDVTRLAQPTSEATGRYRLGPLPAGRYTLVARAVDGTAARRELALEAGETLTLELRTGG
jgi:hypothetical protein